jgi:hypothetical protein
MEETAASIFRTKMRRVKTREVWHVSSQEETKMRRSGSRVREELEHCPGPSEWRREKVLTGTCTRYDP